MYCDFFGLRCRPFEDRADANFLFLTPAFEEALAAMECEVRHDRGTGLVLGEAGIGKTVLVRSLVQRLTASERVVVLTWPASEPPNLIRETAKGFGVSLPGSHQPKRLMGRLRRYLTRALQTDHRSVLIIDQAEHMTADDLGQVASLMDLRADDRRVLSMMLVGQPRLRGMLERPEFTSVAQHLFGEHVLTALRRGQTGDYIQHRLRVAGAADPTLFHENAVGLVHEMSGGIPRLINRICHAAMLAAYGANETHVTREMVEEVTTTARAAIRTLKADELGVVDVEEVAAGLARSGVAAAAAESMTPEALTATCERPAGALRDAFSLCGVGAALGADDDWVPSSYPETGAGGEASVAFDAEGVVTRLERTLARAERVTATTEASIAQFAAVEKHLTSLSAGAERVIGRVQPAVRRSAQSIEEARQRAERIAAQTEDRLRTMEAKLSQAIEAAGQAQRQADRVDRACEQAQDIESRLQSFAEQLADKADEVQERIGLLMTGLEASEATQTNLAALLEKAGAVAADSDKVTDTLKTKADEVVDAATQQIERLSKAFAAAADPDKATEALRAKAQQVVETAARRMECMGQEASTLAAQMEERLGVIRSTFERTRVEAEQFENQFTNAVLRNCREKLQERLEAQFRTQKETIEAAIAEQQARLEELTGRSSTTVRVISETIESTDARVAKQQQQAEDIARCLNQMDATLSTLPDRVADASERLSKVDEKATGLDDLVNRLSSRAEATREGLSGIVPAAETLLREVQAAYGRIEAVQQSVKTALVDIGGARERVHALRERVDGCDDLVRRLDAQEASARATLGAFEETMSGSRPIVECLREAVAEASEQHRSLDAQHTAVGEMLGRLDEVHAAGHTVLERTALSTQAAEKAADTAAQRSGELNQLQESSRTVARELNDLVTSGRQVHESMQGLVTHADAKIGQFDSHQAAAAHAIGELSELQEPSRTMVRQLDDLVTSGRQLHEAMQGLVVHTDAKIGQLDSHQAAAAHAIGALAEANRTAHTAIEQANASAGRAVEAAATAARQADRLTELQTADTDAVHRLDERINSARASQETMREQVDRTEALAARLDAGHAEASTTLDGLSEANRNGHAVIEQANASAHRVVEAAATAAQQAERLAVLQTANDGVAQRLEERIATARESGERIEGLMSRGEALAAQLAGRSAEAASVLHNLSEVSRGGQPLVDQLRDAMAGVEETARTGQETAQRLRDLTAAGGSVTVQLAELVATANHRLGELAASANHADQSVRDATTHADECFERIEAAGAEAGRLIQELASATDGGCALLERTDESKRALEALVENATASTGRLREEAAAVTARTDTGIKGLNERNATAASLTEKLGAVLTTAGPLAVELARHTDRAQQQMATLAERCGQVVGLADRLKAVSRQVEAANDTASAVRKATETARATRDQLIEAVGAAGEHSANLRQTSTSVREMIETCVRLKGEGEGVRDQLAAQLEAARHAIEAGEPLLSEYVAQARDLQQQLEELQAGVAAVEHGLREATAAPARLVADAQVQAAQLERVCAAVRKVFAGLSQASLEVRKHSAECAEATKQADERFTRLTAETDRSVRMLHEWVEEADHAQARLERTLGQCPSIRETHPTTPIARMTAQSRLAGRIANTSAVGELAELSEPSGTDRLRSSTTGKRSGHGENVAQLIAEARQAVAEARS